MGARQESSEKALALKETLGQVEGRALAGMPLLLLAARSEAGPAAEVVLLSKGLCSLRT